MKRHDVKAEKQELMTYVGKKVGALQSGLEPSSSQSRRDLAELRRAVGTSPAEVASTWVLEFEEFPQDLVGPYDEPSPAEWAAHLTFTFYALHQQSKSESMHKRGKENGLGLAIKQLQVKLDAADDGMPPRFVSFVQADGPEALGYFGRQLVTQLRTQSIPLDYVQLAGDLFDYLQPFSQSQVRLKWCREYVKPVPNEAAAEPLQPE